MLESPGISEYRKVKISDRSGQSAGNPLKIGDTLEGVILQKKERNKMSKDKSFADRAQDWWDEQMKDPEFKRRVEEAIKNPSKSVPVRDLLKKLKGKNRKPKT